MEITGIVRHALEMRSGVSSRTGNQWASRDYVLEIPGQYPKFFVFTVFGEERIKAFALRKDETVTVSFDIDANEYQGKWYNKVQAWKVDRVAGMQPVQQVPPQQIPPQQATQYAASPYPPQQQQGNASDDLPF